MPSADTRKPTDLTLDTALLRAARDLGINLSRAAEEGLRRAVAQAQAAQWQRENADALESSNDFVRRQGLPLDGFRRF